ncbi:hypothetical protein GC163_19510 [bacterium]|nr:hypothetical protein [bacterium]
MESWQQQVTRLMQSGNKIEAIKVYREATGASLLDAKNFVEELEQTLATGQLPAAAPAGNSAEVSDEELLELVRQGQRLQAIKRYRERERVGLAEAAAGIDQLAKEAGITLPKAGCFGVLLAIVIPLSGILYLTAWITLQ